MAGLTNLVSLTITTGPAAILNQSILELTSESGLMFQPMECGLAVVMSQTDEEYTNAEYHIELVDEDHEQKDSKMSSRWTEDHFSQVLINFVFSSENETQNVSSLNDLDRVITFAEFIILL